MFAISEVKKESAELRELIAELDAFQEQLYPAESNHCIDVSAVDSDAIRCVIARDNDGVAVGCGAVLFTDKDAGEIKRVFVKPSCRGMNLGNDMIATLEKAAREKGCTLLRLETGIHQQPAIKLYQNCGYRLCDPFPPYTPDPLSVFMYKDLAE